MPSTAVKRRWRRLRHDVDAIFAGDAADRRLLERAGSSTRVRLCSPTNEDAMNIYLAVYCRRLNPDLRIVSRITHERNLEAIHRAGADFVLSYTTLGIEAVMSLLRGHPPVLLGEGVELFSGPGSAMLAGRPLRDSGIGSRTGLSVVALQRGDQLIAPLTSETVLARRCRARHAGQSRATRRIQCCVSRGVNQRRGAAKSRPVAPRWCSSALPTRRPSGRASDVTPCISGAWRVTTFSPGRMASTGNTHAHSPPLDSQVAATPLSDTDSLSRASGTAICRMGSDSVNGAGWMAGTWISEAGAEVHRNAASPSPSLECQPSPATAGEET